MATYVVPSLLGVTGNIPTNCVLPGSDCNMEIARDPGDTYYSSSVTIQNVAIGSSYELVDDLGNSLSTGTVTSSPFVVANVPAYSVQPLIRLRLRKSSAAPKYFPFEQFSYHSKSGASIYAFQSLNTLVDLG